MAVPEAHEVYEAVCLCGLKNDTVKVDPATRVPIVHVQLVGLADASHPANAELCQPDDKCWVGIPINSRSRATAMVNKSTGVVQPDQSDKIKWNQAVHRHRVGRGPIPLTAEQMTAFASRRTTSNKT